MDTSIPWEMEDYFQGGI
ncbi:hypothetical protein HU200_053834 [Digitaria exilis]|uniref:Uncharacterized protein n=1 Tax=Digitaria exilis TaxID=1010633 RepID=A0A835ALY5_9POAL|nr:hypothetical protein HU200_053834 [Digitaria exilis]